MIVMDLSGITTVFVRGERSFRRLRCNFRTEVLLERAVMLHLVLDLYLNHLTSIKFLWI